MSISDEIAAKRAATVYQLQVVPEGAEPYADTTAETRTDARTALAKLVADRLADGYQFGDSEAPGELVLERTTTVMQPVESVERVRLRVAPRSAWDALATSEQDALLVADARERGVGDFPVEWLPAGEQAAEREQRQSKLTVKPGPVGALG